MESHCNDIDTPIIHIKEVSSCRKNTTFYSPSFGGGGGNKRYNLDCGKRSVMVGAIYKVGSWFDALGIICQRVNPKTGALGDEFTRGPAGGTGGKARIKRCKQGEVAQGILANSRRFVNRLVAFCSKWVPARKAPVFSTDGRCGERQRNRCKRFGGSSGGSTSAFFCPRGKVGKAFRGKYGW